ncbi:hypothetical protein [Candidatus Burkholderia verschuerenii]|uniref:hypothetical protein n=1 Tax=Candidatus Burkholderia verschuerenii TaxID=242163 RepID=UPI000AB87598|nr:hypothetical protein [Candidatus Burkholderia verschuerenii]
MASDGEDRIQREYHGASAEWLSEAAAAQPFGRLIDPKEAARACSSVSGERRVGSDDRLDGQLRSVGLGRL